MRPLRVGLCGSELVIFSLCVSQKDFASSQLERISQGFVKLKNYVFVREGEEAFQFESAFSIRR